MASGRFLFHKKNLYYSFYLSDSATRPKSIQFVDHTGAILIEQSLATDSGPHSIYQNVTEKICGVWRRVPRDYRRLLRDDQMHVVLVWKSDNYMPGFALAGPIGKYSALSKESFSALLEPLSNTDEMNGAGGTAIVSISTGVTSSVYVTVVFNGVFGVDDLADVPLYLRLETHDKKFVVVNETIRIKKPNYDINVAEISSSVSPSDIRLLTKGRLIVSLESKRQPGLFKIHGSVITRVACDVFQTVLSPHTFDNSIVSSGLIWMYLKKDGSLVYNLHTDKWHHNDTNLSLIDDLGKRKNEIDSIIPILENNFASGSFEKLGPRFFEQIYQNGLSVNLSSLSDSSVSLKGRLTMRPIADARDSYAPALLKRTHNINSSNVAGMAWFSVDNECTLHYDISLTGLHNQQLELLIDERPLDVPGAPITTTRLEEFTGNFLEGFTISMTQADLKKLETHVINVEIVSKARNETILRSRVKPIKIPKCGGGTDNDVPYYQKADPNEISSASRKCFHYDRFYDEGQQWPSTTESCTMCSCVHERVKCDPIKCPPLKCKTEDIIQPTKGACCASCNREYFCFNFI